MNELVVGYARVSTEQQDLTAQRNGLHALGLGDDRIYVDHGLTGGDNRDRPRLRLALAACRAGDTLRQNCPHSDSAPRGRDLTARRSAPLGVGSHA